MFFSEVDTTDRNMGCNSHIAHGISASCCPVLLCRWLFQAEEDEEILHAAPDPSGEDQPKQGLKTQGGEESLHEAHKEIVVNAKEIVANAIDMEAGLETP